METVIMLAGIGQIALAAVSPVIPVLLGWRAETARLTVLTRQVFWTYAGYILMINLSFGVLSAMWARRLLAVDPLAAAVDGFIGVYWGARLLVQLFYFDRANVPAGPVYRLADAGLTVFFAFLFVVYGSAAMHVTLALRAGGWR